MLHHQYWLLIGQFNTAILTCDWLLQDPAPEPVHQTAGDGEQLARVRAGVPQREAVQVSVIQLYVSRYTHHAVSHPFKYIYSQSVHP